jgi:hypothetical protein
MGGRWLIGAIGLTLGLAVGVPASWAADELVDSSVLVPATGAGQEDLSAFSGEASQSKEPYVFHTEPGTTAPWDAEEAPGDEDSKTGRREFYSDETGVHMVESDEGPLSEASREQILSEIEATRQTDPALAAEMEEQLRQLDAGELELHSMNADGGVAPDAPSLETSGGLPTDGLLLGPPVDAGTGPTADSLPPEVRAQLEKLFDEQGTGDPAKDGAVREEAERILREAGIDPREVGPGHEGWDHEGWDREGAEHSWEQMSPEAREQMERFMSEHELEGPMREYEGMTHEYEAPSAEFEAPTHEYEAPTYEAPTHEYEAPMYEAPTYEGPMYEGGMTPSQP